MIKIRVHFFIVVYLAASMQIVCKGQKNLVLNPSFEEYLYCPTGINETPFPCKYWSSDIPVWSTPDYYNSCATDSVNGVPYNSTGYCKPEDGNAYIGIGLMILGPNDMEHIRGKVSIPLLSGHKYEVSFYTKLAYQYSEYATYNIGAYLSADSTIHSDTYYTDGMSPDLKASVSNKEGDFIKDTTWVKISGTYIAGGGEKYITLGLFWDTVPAIVKAWQKSNGSIELGHAKMNKVIKKYMLCPNRFMLKKYINAPSKIGYRSAYYYIDNVSVTEIQ